MKSTYWPDDESVAPSRAHVNEYGVTRFYPDGVVPWGAGRAPDLTCGHNMYTRGRLRGCGYCGSMHPSDLVAALKAGGSAGWADRKYGWPHKLYVDGFPNPYAGMPNATTSIGYRSTKGELHPRDKEYIDAHGGVDAWVQLRSTMDDDKKDEFVSWPWYQKSVEGATSHGKFYTVHLVDATPEERPIIERAMGLHFDFADGKVAWWPFGTTRPGEVAAGTVRT